MRKIKYEFSDFIGKKFGRLEVIGSETVNGRRKLLCLCECGNKKSVAIDKIASGHTQSCGCYHIDRTKESSLIHGKSNTRLHKIWRDMQARCYQPTDYHYEWWGARGIKVCDEWLGKKSGFVNFYNWAMANGYDERLTIDRRDNDKDYSPDNCIWTTIYEQSHNRRVFKNNTSGIAGVYRDKKSGKWRVSITVNYKKISLGRYNTLAEAAKVRREAEIKYWNKNDPA